MRKAADLILIALVLAGIGVGAYTIGRAVTRESDAASERSSGQTLGASTSTATTASKPRRDTRDLQILVAKIVAAALVVVALLATVNALLRSSRLERWER